MNYRECGGISLKYGNASVGRTLIVHLDRGEDLLESLRECVESQGIHNGVILTGFGTLDRCRLRAITTTSFPPEDQFTTVEGPLELVSIDGVIAGGEIHAHFEVAGPKGCFGGHLELGCRVLYLCDIVIGEINNVDLTFERCSKTGLRLLSIKPGCEETGPSVELDDNGQVAGISRATGWDEDGK